MAEDAALVGDWMMHCLCQRSPLHTVDVSGNPLLGEHQGPPTRTAALKELYIRRRAFE